MRKELKEFYVASWNERTCVPEIITGPFENIEQSKQAIDALQPLHDERLVYVGGELWSWPGGFPYHHTH